MCKKLLILFFSIFYFLPALASENSIYDFKWLDQDKKIYVLQNRKFKKDKSFYLGLNGAVNISDPFLDSFGGQLRMGYFFTEDWGLEIVHGMFSGEKSDEAKGVLEQGIVPFIREVTSYTNAYLVWSPFYGKINTFNSIVYFDWTFGIGMTQVTTQDNRNRLQTGGDESLVKETNAGLSWTTGMRFYLTRSFALRADFTAMHFKADRGRREGSGTTFYSSEYFHNYDFSVGLNYTF